MSEKKIFALHPIQEESIKEFCFGKCGKIVFGCIRFAGIETMFPCKEEKCEYEEIRVRLGKLNTGEIMYLRKLKEVKENE